MTDKELRKLSRKGLLQVLIAQTKESDRLKSQVELLQKELDNKKLLYSDIGSLAEESLKINSVYESAQKAADMYLAETEKLKAQAKEEYDNAISKARSDFSEEREKIIADLKMQSQNEHDAIIQNAKQEAEKIIQDAEKTANERLHQAAKKVKQANEYVAYLKRNIDKYQKEHPEINNNEAQEPSNNETEKKD